MTQDERYALHRVWARHTEIPAGPGLYPGLLFGHYCPALLMPEAEGTALSGVAERP